MSIDAQNDDLFSSQLAELQALRQTHRELDQTITALMETPPPNDELQLRRLKKQKLALKDRIQALEALLEPDIPA